MRKFKNDELTGYRPPTQWEKEHICLYMARNLKKIRKVMVTGAVLAGISSFALFCTLFMEKISTVRMYMLYGSLLMLFFTGFLKILKRIRWNGIYQTAIQSGAFEIMDCTAFDIDMCTESGSEPVAKIRNKQGQESTCYFSIDYDSAKLVKEDSNLPFYLMKTKIGIEKEELYELFSERKMTNAETK